METFFNSIIIIFIHCTSIIKTKIPFTSWYNPCKKHSVFIKRKLVFSNCPIRKSFVILRNKKYSTFTSVVFAKETRKVLYVNTSEFEDFKLTYELHLIFFHQKLEFHLSGTADENQHLILLHPEPVKQTKITNLQPVEFLFALLTATFLGKANVFR